MDSRIIVNIDDLSLDIRRILDDVQEMRTDKLFLDIMGKTASEIKEWAYRLKAKEQEPFNLVIIGDFKRGKSTLINAILGKYIVRTNVLPETATINRIRYGDTDSAVAILQDGKKARLTLEELSRDKLQKIIEELPAPIQYVEIESNNPILKEISVVDTPGLGDLFQAYDEVVKEYIQKADALIYVSSARAPLSLSERAFISALSIPDRFSRFYLVINMMDTLDSQEDMAKVSSRTKELMDDLVAQTPIFPLSALDEYSRIMDMKRPRDDMADQLALQFEYFRSMLSEDILVHKDVIRAQRIAATADTMLCQSISFMARMMDILSGNMSDMATFEKEQQEKNQELVREVESAISKINLNIDQMCVQSINWMSQFMERLKEEILSLETAVTTDQLQKHFQFYMIEMIRNALTACTSKHQEIVMEQINQTAVSISKINSVTEVNIDGEIATQIVDIGWTGADTAGLVMTLMVSSMNLGILGTLGQAAIGFVRQHQVRNRQQEYLQPLLLNFDSMKNHVTNELKNVYAEFKKQTEATLRTCYESELAQSRAMVEQAIVFHQKQAVNTQEATAYLQRRIDELQDLRKILTKYK